VPDRFGIWVDRSMAIVIRVNREKCHTWTMSSGVENAPHPRSGTENRCTTTDERRDCGSEQTTVREFHQRIVAMIGNADAVLILGPGTAKLELLDEINSAEHPRHRVVGVETADTLSVRQLEARVMSFFRNPPDPDPARTGSPTNERTDD